MITSVFQELIYYLWNYENYLAEQPVFRQLMFKLITVLRIHIVKYRVFRNWEQNMSKNYLNPNSMQYTITTFFKGKTHSWKSFDALNFVVSALLLLQFINKRGFNDVFLVIFFHQSIVETLLIAIGLHRSVLTTPSIYKSSETLCFIPSDWKREEYRVRHWTNCRKNTNRNNYRHNINSFMNIRRSLRLQFSSLKTCFEKYFQNIYAFRKINSLTLSRSHSIVRLAFISIKW